MSGRRAIVMALLAAGGLTAALFAILDQERGALARPACRVAVSAFAGGADEGEALAAVLAVQLSGIRGVDASGPAELAAGERGPFNLRLAGRLQAAGPRLAITMTWLDGAGGAVRRRLGLAADRGRIFDLQERLALATIDLCAIRPTFAERRALARGLASSLPAYWLTLRARALLDGAAPDRDAAAAGLLRQALADDSECALAHAALAEALAGEGRGEEAVAEAERARELDDHLPAIHLVLVRADRAAGREAQAQIELRRLLSLRPEIAAARRALR